MITRARVIKKLDTYGYKWAVNIPILNGLPDDANEYKSYQNKLKSAQVLNGILPEDKRKSEAQIAEVTSKSWSNEASTLLDLQYLTNSSDRITISDFTMEASVCGIPGIVNYIHVNDIVYVGFEDNDMGKPVILGHLLTQDLESVRTQFPGQKLSTLVVTDDSTLPSTAKIKTTTANEINIQELLFQLKQFKDTYAELLGGLEAKLALLMPNPTSENN